MVKFILITSQRTGSTFISNYLHNHPQIGMYEEVMLTNSSTPGGLVHYVEGNKFKKILFRLYNFRFIKALHAKIPIFIPINIIVKQYLDSFFKMNKEYINNNNYFNNSSNQLIDEPKALGFKVMANHINSIPYIKKWILENDVKIIILKRHNILEKYVSNVASYQRKIAHSTKQVEKVKVKVDLIHFKRYLENTINEYKMLDTFKEYKDYISINYEDFFAHPEFKITEIFKFLGIKEKIHVENPKLKKLNSQSLEDIVVNYDEVVKSLQQQNLKYIYKPD